MKSLSVRSFDVLLLGTLFVFGGAIASIALMPRTASAATVSLTTITATSSNVATSYAKLGDSVNYLLTLDSDPLIVPKINIFGLGSTTMTKTSTGTYVYATTTNSINAWSDGAVTFKISVGGTTGVEATSTVTQASVTTNVTYDTTAPTNPTGVVGQVFHGYTTMSLASTDTNSVTVYYTTDGTTPTCTNGTAYSSSITVSQSTAVQAVACDAAGNLSSVVSGIYSPAAGGDSERVYVAPASTSGPTTPVTQTTVTTTSEPAVSTAAPAVVETSVVQTSTATTPNYMFARNLIAGTSNSDVKTLQQYLNAKGFNITGSGSGSAGNETTFFGGLTKAALVKFQKSVGITPASGYFGPKTRAYIAAHQ